MWTVSFTDEFGEHLKDWTGLTFNQMTDKVDEFNDKVNQGEYGLDYQVILMRQ